VLRQVLCANLSYFSSLASPIVAQAADDLTAVGIVDKVENEAKVVSGDTVTPAIIGTLVHLKDELRTGVDGRLKITSRDDTVLTLGEKASVIIDRYVCDPDQMSARPCTRPPTAPFASPQAASRGLKQNKIAVSTPVADIGVRGTEFWGGLLDKYGVLVLEGEITVSNQAGSVTLFGSGQGTDIPSPLDPPGPVKAWSAQKIARAVATVALH